MTNIILYQKAPIQVQAFTLMETRTDKCALREISTITERFNDRRNTTIYKDNFSTIVLC